MYHFGEQVTVATHGTEGSGGTRGLMFVSRDGITYGVIAKTNAWIAGILAAVYCVIFEVIGDYTGLGSVSKWIVLGIAFIIVWYQEKRLVAKMATMERRYRFEGINGLSALERSWTIPWERVEAVWVKRNKLTVVDCTGDSWSVAVSPTDSTLGTIWGSKGAANAVIEAVRWFAPHVDTEEQDQLATHVNTEKQDQLVPHFDTEKDFLTRNLPK